MSDEAILVSDGHGWETVYRNPKLEREVQECKSHGKDPGCGIRKFGERGGWIIADHAPWVTEEDVAAHARAGQS